MKLKEVATFYFGESIGSRVVVLCLGAFVLTVTPLAITKTPSTPLELPQDVISGSRPTAWLSIDNGNKVPLAINLRHITLCWPDPNDLKGSTVIRLESGLDISIPMSYKDLWRLMGRAAGK